MMSIVEVNAAASFKITKAFTESCGQHQARPETETFQFGVALCDFFPHFLALGLGKSQQQGTKSSKIFVKQIVVYVVVYATI